MCVFVCLFECTHHKRVWKHLMIKYISMCRTTFKWKAITHLKCENSFNGKTHTLTHSTNLVIILRQFIWRCTQLNWISRSFVNDSHAALWPKALFFYLHQCFYAKKFAFQPIFALFENCIQIYSYPHVYTFLVWTEWV